MKKTIIAALILASLMTACTAKPNVPEATAQPEASAPAVVTEEAAKDEKVSFETTDINGSAVSMSDFSDKKVVMINFWETWCPPCVDEMPDIEELYEKYRDSGFAVLGVFACSTDAEVLSLINELGITYSVFGVTESLTKYQTQYVPTTIFVDGSGKLLTKEPYVGSKSHDEWENIITSLLG